LPSHDPDHFVSAALIAVSHGTSWWDYFVLWIIPVLLLALSRSIGRETFLDTLPYIFSNQVFEASMPRHSDERRE